MKTYIDTLAKNALPIALGAAVLLGVVYYLGRKTVSDVASGVGGLVSGDNAITKGTAYESTGAVGTLGASVDAIAGSALSRLGEWLGETSYNIFNPQPTGYSMTYIVIMPDGSKKGINSESLDSQSRFTLNGKRWQIVINQANQKVAVAA